MKRTIIIWLVFITTAVFPAAASSEDWAYGCFTGGDVQTRNDIFFLVNRERLREELSPLACDFRLSEIAQAHAMDMARRGYFSHISPEGKSPFDRLRDAGVTYRLAAENIAWRYRDARSVVKGWMNSAGHRRNILGDFTKAGVGSYRGYSVLLLTRD